MAATTTRAQYIRDIQGKQHTDEAAILKDIPYILQAISSQCIIFSNNTTASFKLALPAPLTQLLSLIIEAGLLYRNVSRFATTDHNDGLIRQSLRANFAEELTSYLNKVSVIEGHIREQGDEHKVTLKRVILWIRDDVLRLRLMNHMIEQIAAMQGGELINVIFTLSTHGDPFIQNFTRRILKEISIPFYEMLGKWIYEGELVDPHAEFPVSPTNTAATHSRPGSSDTSENAWKGKYVLIESKVPRWISQQLAQKIYLIGKSLNFIRYTCGDAQFVSEHCRQNPDIPEYGDTSALERSIDDAYSVTAQHLRTLMLEKFHLADHLLALKRYILLGAGDFVSVLMERLGESLEHPASTLHRHNLTSSLGDAIQTSNAQYEPEHVLRYLDARMLEGTRGTVGWEVFTLEYRLEKPVDVIISEQSARQYLKIFNFLWRLKRVDYALDSAWRRQMTSERGMLNQVAAVTSDWKQVRGTSAEMIHFICQLQYYILYEVVENSWSILQQELAKPACDLDGIIAAHTDYVKAIIDKALLGSHQRGEKEEREEDCLSLLHEILKTMLAYKDQVDQLYSYTLTQYTLLQSSGSRHKKYDTTRDGSEETGESENLTSIRSRLHKLTAEFRESTSYLLAALAYQKSETMRFLAVRLNYNEFYPIPRPRKHRSGREREKDRTREPSAR